MNNKYRGGSMKKYLKTLISIVLVFSLSACSNVNENHGPNTFRGSFNNDKLRRAIEYYEKYEEPIQIVNYEEASQVEIEIGKGENIQIERIASVMEGEDEIENVTHLSLFKREGSYYNEEIDYASDCECLITYYPSGNELSYPFGLTNHNGSIEIYIQNKQDKRIKIEISKILINDHDTRISYESNPIFFNTIYMDTILYLSDYCDFIVPGDHQRIGIIGNIVDEQGNVLQSLDQTVIFDKDRMDEVLTALNRVKELYSTYEVLYNIVQSEFMDSHSPYAGEIEYDDIGIRCTSFNSCSELYSFMNQYFTQNYIENTYNVTVLGLDGVDPLFYEYNNHLYVRLNDLVDPFIDHVYSKKESRISIQSYSDTAFTAMIQEVYTGDMQPIEREIDFVKEEGIWKIDCVRIIYEEYVTNLDI